MGREEQLNDGLNPEREMVSRQVARWVAEVCGRSLGEGAEADVRCQAILLLSGVLDGDPALVERHPDEVPEEARRAMLAVLPFACPVERPLRMPVQPLETLVDGLFQPMPVLQPAR